MAASMTPHDFVEKWRKAQVKERSGYQEHFLDLCRLLGHPTPLEDDPTGERFTFEAGAAKQAGGSGWADVWKRGYFAIEYKGKHANLDKAYQQLLQYREALYNPPLLIVSDMETIQIHTNFTNTAKRTYTLTLDDLLTKTGEETLRRAFYQPDALRSDETAEQVTDKAARDFARLAELLRKYGAEPQRAAHFLIRLLFCLFAEDTGLLPDGLFSRLIQRTRSKASVFTQQLSQLFAAMSEGGWFGTDEIPHFNGRLFDSAEVLELDSESLDILQRVSQLDWSAIEPAILGTLFERSLDPAKRSQLGAHYTSRDDILLIVEPVLMQPLRRRWAELQDHARAIVEKRESATKGQRTTLDNQLLSTLLTFQNDLTEIRVLDPACGSGNFLYVALKQLLDLEKAVITFMGDVGLTRPFPRVSPEQLYGIELNEYAHELAQITVWIGYIQWLRDNGFGRPSEPILKPLDTIRQMDAILAFDEQDQPVEPEWPKADVIIGNPPFLGDKRMRGELGDQYVTTLRKLYEGRVTGGSDLVMYWFERARTLIAQGKTQRAGLIATNSIRQPGNRHILETIKDIGDIFLAWSDRPWVLDGAAVRVSIVGFDAGKEQDRFLNGNQVQNINSDLTGSSDLTKAVPLNENTGLCFLGMMKAGPFDIDAGTATSMLAAHGNPNGRPNSDVVKRRLIGRDITSRSSNSWVIDFGEITEADACNYQRPFEYVREYVKPIRDQNRRDRTRRRWWLYGETRPALRRAMSNLQRVIVTPEVAKHRIFVWMNTETVPDHTLHVITRSDDYFFGVVQSHIHELWSLAQGARMGAGNDPRYSSARTFSTFPFPWPPGTEPTDDPRVQAIAEAAHELVEKRGRYLNPDNASEAELKKQTLTNLYNERPTWLNNAHKALDQAVLAAYGWPADLSDEEILERLLALNLERAAAQGAAPALAKQEDNHEAGD